MNEKLIVGEMDCPDGEMDHLQAKLTSIKPEDIPLSDGVDMEMMKSYDDDPLEVVVEIPASVSTKRWKYTKKAIEDIVKATNERTLNGFLGHQKPENVSNEFVPPVTHWVGAEMRGNKGYFRGLIDKSATDLKRWIRTKRIKEVSIFGFPKLEKVNGAINVVGYDPLSIDWTPLHRPGMPTRIVGMELSGNVDELQAAVREAAREQFGREAYIADMNYKKKEAIIEYQSKLYQINYTEKEDEVVVSDTAMEVRREINYVPVKGEKTMNLQDVVNAANEGIQKGTFTVGELAQALGINGEMGNTNGGVGASQTTEAYLRKLLGVQGEMNTIKAQIQAGAEALKEKETVAKKEKISEAIKAKVFGEMNQTLVAMMMDKSTASTDEEIAGELDTILADENFKAMCNKINIEQGAGVSGEMLNKTVASVRVKKNRI